MPSLPTIHPTVPTQTPIIVYLQPNRYDTANGKLLSGPPGDWLQYNLRKNNIDPGACTFTTDPDFNKYAVATRIALGDYMQRQLTPATHLTLNEDRGYIHTTPSGPLISTFAAVDCCEVMSHEPEAFDNDDDDGEESAATNKDSAPTRRSNYRFWFGADFEKLLSRPPRASATYTFNVVRHASLSTLCNVLNGLTNELLLIDIETHPPTNTVQCLSFMAGLRPPVYSVPIYGTRGQSFFHVPTFFAALVRAFQRNTVVGHNISFDTGFLFHYHGVPYGPRMIDTMLNHHRAFPEAEKSLAHTMSYWINAPYHKDSAGTFTPYNTAQYDTLLDYNARDVLALGPVLRSQMKRGLTDEGYRLSCKQVSDCIEPYLTATFTGFSVNNEKHRQAMKKAEDASDDLERVIRILVGHPEFNPASSQQVGKWLYEGLGYAPPELTDTGAGKTDMKCLYQLLLKYPANVALKLLISYKELSKQVSMLGYTPYYINEGRH